MIGDSAEHSEISPFDSLAVDYDTWFDKDGKLIFAIEVKALQEILPFLPKPWLEIGVGSGRFAQVLGIETGIDPSANLLKMAKNRGITVFQTRGEERFFTEATFGAVFLIVTLCFVDSPLKVLREAHRILKPAGKVVLGLVLRGSPWGKFYQSRKREGHRFYKHATLYNYQEVEQLLKDSEFTIEKVVSTLFQTPGNVKKMETAREGFFTNAGFTVIVAEKTSTDLHK